MRKEIMGVTFDDVTLEEAVAAGEALAAGPGFSHRFASPLSYFPARGRELHIIRVIVTRIHPFVYH